MMDGLRLLGTRSRGRSLAESVLDLAESRTGPPSPHAFGTFGLSLAVQQDSRDCAFAGEAFLASSGPTRAHLAVATADARDIALLDLEWARPWIATSVPVPSSLTHPYRILVDRGLGFVQVADTRTTRAAVLMRGHADLDQRTLIAPFRTALGWLARSLGGVMIHAAGIRFAGTGALISGRSGAGKSTSAFALLADGGRILGDDSVLVDGRTAHAVYGRAKLARESLAQVDVPAHALRKPPSAPDAKAVVDLRALGDSFVTRMEITQVVFPRISRATAFADTDARTVCDLLFAHSWPELRDRSPFDFRAVSALSRCTRGTIATVRRDVSGLAEAYAVILAPLEAE